MSKYVLLIPMGGLNDSFNVIHDCIQYCKKYKRILLLHTVPSELNINFSDFFDLDDKTIIYDSKKIEEIINSNKLSVYPKDLTSDLLNIFNCNCPELVKVSNGKFDYKTRKNVLCYHQPTGGFTYHESKPLLLPNNKVDEDLIIYSKCSRDIPLNTAILVLKSLKFSNYLKEECKKKMKQLPQEYLCIQVRNTDNKCDYKSLYLSYKNRVDSYSNVYIATDSKDVLEYFKYERNGVFNLTTYPEIEGKNLHTNISINANIRFCDSIRDLLIAANSQGILSNSQGGYITLMRNCLISKKEILYKLN